MRNSQLRMLAVLMCGLVAFVEGAPVPGFDVNLVTGKWYLIGFASNADWFVASKAGMKMGTAMFTLNAESDLHMSYAHLEDNGNCWRMDHMAHKTDTPGRFTFVSKTWNNENDMSFTDVQYDTYAIISTIKTKDGVAEVLTKLYGRTQDVSDALKQKFIEYSTQSGILPDNIVILPKTGECPELS